MEFLDRPIQNKHLMKEKYFLVSYVFWFNNWFSQTIRIQKSLQKLIFFASWFN